MTRRRLNGYACVAIADRIAGFIFTQRSFVIL